MIGRYISTLSVTDDTKRKTRKDITAFVEILKSHGRTWPEECDYEEYKEALSKDGKTENTVKDSISRIKKFYAWCKDHSLRRVAYEDDVTPFEPVEVSKTEAAKRFSLIFPKSVYEALEWLSKYDNCSIAQIVVNACTSYTGERKGDIEFISEQFAGLTRKIEERKGATI